MNLEDSGSSLATIKNPTVNDEKCGRGYCRCFDFLVNVVSSLIRASAANQSFYNIEVAIVLCFCTALFWPVKLHQKLRIFATKQLAKIGHNWIKFRILYVKKYIALKEVHQRLCWWCWLISVSFVLLLVCEVVFLQSLWGCRPCTEGHCQRPLWTLHLWQVQCFSFFWTNISNASSVYKQWLQTLLPSNDCRVYHYIINEAGQPMFVGTHTSVLFYNRTLSSWVWWGQCNYMQTISDKSCFTLMTTPFPDWFTIQVRSQGSHHCRCEPFTWGLSFARFPQICLLFLSKSVAALQISLKGVHSVDFSKVRDDKCHVGVGQSRVRPCQPFPQPGQISSLSVISPCKVSSNIKKYAINNHAPKS